MAEVNCCGEQIVYGTPEAIEKQKRAVIFMGKIKSLHLGLGFISFVSAIGALDCGFRANTISYPIVDILPLLTSVFALLSGFFALKASKCSLDIEAESKKAKRYFVWHYGFCVTNISIATCACTFAGWALGVCYSTAIKKIPKCLPDHSFIEAFAIANCVSALLISIASLVGIMSFCMYARAFGFSSYNNDERVSVLEGRVADLQRQLAQNAPPPYDEPPSYTSLKN